MIISTVNVFSVPPVVFQERPSVPSRVLDRSAFAPHTKSISSAEVDASAG